MLQTSSAVCAKWLSEMLNEMYYGRIDPYCLALMWAKHDTVAWVNPYSPTANTDIIQLMSTQLVLYTTTGINGFQKSYVSTSVDVG